MAGLEEEFLQQKAKLHWLDKGDQNNKTFHSSITLVRHRMRSERSNVKMAALLQDSLG